MLFISSISIPWEISAENGYHQFWNIENMKGKRLFLIMSVIGNDIDQDHVILGSYVTGPGQKWNKSDIIRSYQGN